MFPRTISTHRSKGSLFGKEQIAKAYEESHFIDCRINAYPWLENITLSDTVVSNWKGHGYYHNLCAEILHMIKLNFA